MQEIDPVVRAVQLTACLHTLGILVAVGAGFFAAARLKKMGAPPLGPIAVAFGVTTLGAVGLAFLLLELLFSDSWGSLAVRVLAFGAMFMDVIGTIAILAGLALLRGPPLDGGAAPEAAR